MMLVLLSLYVFFLFAAIVIFICCYYYLHFSSINTTMISLMILLCHHHHHRRRLRRHHPDYPYSPYLYYYCKCVIKAIIFWIRFFLYLIFTHFLYFYIYTDSDFISCYYYARQTVFISYYQ